MPTLKVKQAVAPTRAEIIAAHSLPHFLAQRVEELRPAGRNFVTNACPVAQHKTYHRCVTIDTEKDLWHCNDCDRGGTVIDWVMLEKNVSAADAMRILGDERNNSELPGDETRKGPPRRRIAKTYDYTDEAGKLLFQCVRYVPKKFSQRRPDGHGGWIWNLKGVRRILYRLPEVIKADTVTIAEGEKDADNLTRLGFTATTNPLGAGNWLDEYTETLRGKDVVIFGDVGDDNREGEKHVERVIRSLAGVADSIKHARLPNGFHDISDYIASLPAERATGTIRKLIDETPEVDFKSGNSVDVDEPVELPPAPKPYVAPPLGLLPLVLQEFVHAGAEMLNVDISFILLPLLSAIGSAIGNARSILLKLGYIQPPNIWTGILGPSGTLKSPSIETACFANDERERELDQQNREAQEIYAEDLAQWESQKKSLRGRKPDPPEIKTCKMDDLTLEALADRLQSNPRGVLVAKDEISGFFESFDLYRKNKGADVSRWLSLHSGAHFGIDRRTDNRHQRIWLPRVCITGGVQPKVFKRLMRQDYFERGLPARFIFAAPPCKLKWSDSIIPDDLVQAVRELFDQLWLLQPNHDNHKQPAPMLLRLTGGAREEYIAFYNQCGASAAESSENEAAAWSKLPGYGGRFALEGQLTCNPEAEKVTGEVMRAACELARWSGNETARIYAQLSETPWQQAQRKLLEFIECRGGAVYEREVMQSFTRLKNDKEGTDRELTALIKAGLGKWEPVVHGGGPGRPTRKFRLLRSSTSTQFGISRGKTENSVDVDTYRGQEIIPAGEPKIEPVSDKESASEPSGIVIGEDPEGETIL